MVTKKNVISLAKSGTATAKKPVAKKRKPTARKSAKKLSPAQVRDNKAKAKVEELLQDVDLSLDKKDDLLVLDEAPVVEGKGTEWLQEQVTLLSKTNGELRKKLAQSKKDYQKILTSKGGETATDGDVKKIVIDLFNELQENHLKLGVNPQTGVGNIRIYCPGFLNRLIKFFPFLEKVKKY